MPLRTELQVPSVYFGKPGFLVEMPWPAGDMDKPFERPRFDFVTGSGQHAVSSLIEGSRPFTLNWNALHVDNFSKLSQFHVGANGPGPWVLIDPSSPNLLPPNVAAATGLYCDGTSLVTAGGGDGIVESNADTAYVRRSGGYRSIRWRWDEAASTTPELGITPLYRSWWGHPVVPDKNYAFSSWLRADGIVDSSITAAMEMEWLSQDGSSTGSVATTGPQAIAGWQKLSVTATSPSTAAYVVPRWSVTGSSVSIGGSLYIDEPLMEQGSTFNDWAPGTGIRPVEILSLTEAVTFSVLMRKDVRLFLRELTR